MRSSLRQLLLLFLMVLLIVSCILGSFVVWADYSSNIPQERECPPSNGFRLEQYLSEVGVNAKNIREKFPVNVYLDSANWCNATGISRDLQQMDLVNPDSTFLNRELLAQILTTDLQKRMAGIFKTYQPDSLIQILQWADRFSHYKDVDLANAKVYRVVSRHWFNLVSNQLGQLADEQSSIKYDFKFKYLVAFCRAKTFSPPIGNSQMEKVINYFIEKNYSYLFNRFWNSTGWLFKLIVFFGFGLQLYALWCVFKVHFGKKNGYSPKL